VVLPPKLNTAGLAAAASLPFVVGVPELKLFDLPKENIGFTPVSAAPNDGIGWPKFSDTVVVGATVVVVLGGVTPKVVVDVTCVPGLVVLTEVVAGASVLNPERPPTVGPLAGVCPNENMGFDVVVLVILAIVLLVVLVAVPNENDGAAVDFGVPKLISG